MAARNADEALQNISENIKREEARTKGAVKELADYLGLNQLPDRIEAFDISNIQEPTQWHPWLSLKRENQRTEITEDSKSRASRSDDFASMAEVLERRFRRGLEEEGN